MCPGPGSSHPHLHRPSSGFSSALRAAPCPLPVQPLNLYIHRSQPVDPSGHNLYDRVSPPSDRTVSYNSSILTYGRALLDFSHGSYAVWRWRLSLASAGCRRMLLRPSCRWERRQRRIYVTLDHCTHHRLVRNWERSRWSGTLGEMTLFLAWLTFSLFYYFTYLCQLNILARQTIRSRFETWNVCSFFIKKFIVWAVGINIWVLMKRSTKQY
jgi:hypothetical protein